MALFSKKDKKKTAADTTAATTAASSAGTATGQDVAEDFSDFSDFSESALTGAAGSQTTTKAARAPKPPRAARPKGLKGGAVVGLNIGNELIKAVELRASGSSATITALGIAPTPAESVSNGVVMSVSALSRAISDLFRQAGIKTRNVVASVSGTGSLVVRIIEVPAMSDTELAGNIATDIDRYIPFPPSEVVMDFKALRDLPTAPDSANMEVLLAAAQQEIVELYLKVLEGAKLQPQAIDVEPLAAARSLTYRGLDGQAGVDYYNVSALINIGATGTEISVLRGDLLVFTRSVPIGGHTLTQALVDGLGLAWPDAEKLKRELGSALPPHSAGTAGGYAAGAGAASPDLDFSEFANFETAPQSGVTSQPEAGMPESSDWSQFGAADTSATEAGTSAPATGTADPFDPDSFEQGPDQASRKNEPEEQHGQKQDDPPADGEDKAADPFDFSSFSFSDEPEPISEPATGQTTAQPTVQAAQTGETVPADDTAPASEAAPSVFNFDMPDSPAPAETEISDTATGTPAAPAAGMFSFDAVDDSPPLATPSSDEMPVAATEYAAETTDDAGVSSTQPSAYDFGDLSQVAATGAAPDVTSSEIPAAAPATGIGDDFDFSTLSAETPSTAAAYPATAETADMTAGDLTATAATPTTDDFGIGDFSADLTDFGAGLTGAAMPTQASAETAYAVLQPLLEQLVAEVRRSLEYYASRYPDAGVNSITLVGGGSKLANMDGLFVQSLGIPTTVGNPVSRLTLRAPQLPPGYAEENGPLFAVALGLALRDLT